MFNEELRINESYILQQRQDNDRPNYKRPIFNYIQFLKYIDFEELHNAIIDWIQFASENSKINNNYISFGDFFSPIWNWIGFPSTSLSFIISSSSNNDDSIILFKYLANNILNYKQPQNNDQLNDWVAIVICKLLMRNKQNSLISISIEVEKNKLKSGKFRCKHLYKDFQSHIDDEQLDYTRLPESYFILPIFEGSSNCLSNLVEFILQNSLSHFEIYRCPVGFDLVMIALKIHLNSLKLIRLVEVKIENYEILNIINDTSRWEIMDLDISEATHIYDTLI
ncbi:17830_t:CDS:2 [Rhizophagus irregularis]|nr:17830_t:CDS:2 [Rhizophagus irregularis]